MVDGLEGSIETYSNWRVGSQSHVLKGEGANMSATQNTTSEITRTPLRTAEQIALDRITKNNSRQESMSSQEEVLVEDQIKNQSQNYETNAQSEEFNLDAHIESNCDLIEQLTGVRPSHQEMLKRVLGKVEDYNNKLDKQEMIGNNISIKQWLIMLAISSAVEELLGLR